MIYIFWLSLSIILWVYSYGFVDLNLTLSSHPLVFNFVTQMQSLVYFARPLSLNIFILIICLFFLAYTLTLYRFAKRTTPNFPWKPIALLSLILALAYPMLSSDVFKYLFAAKEILVYGANPYLVTPDTFTGDTWIRFMRWVHTPTPYGPGFIALTLPYYILGAGKFVPILYLFKLDQIAWYLLSIWLIGKIAKLRQFSPKQAVLSQLFFALNPLILMEWLVNAHNDAIMITLLMLSLNLFIRNQRGWSILALLASVLIKYITIIFLPFIWLKRYFSYESIINILILILFSAPLLYHYSWQYQPWYVTWLIPLASISQTRWLRYSVAVYSFSVFTRYLYFVGTGSWGGTLMTHSLMTFVPPLLTALFFLFYFLLRPKFSSVPKK